MNKHVEKNEINFVYLFDIKEIKFLSTKYIPIKKNKVDINKLIFEVA